MISFVERISNELICVKDALIDYLFEEDISTSVRPPCYNGNELRLRVRLPRVLGNLQPGSGGV